MPPLRPSATRRLPPALRGVVFVLMLWVIGLFPMFHSDTDELARLRAESNTPARGSAPLRASNRWPTM